MSLARLAGRRAAERVRSVLGLPKPRATPPSPPAHRTTARLLLKIRIKSGETRVEAILLDPPAAAARFSPSELPDSPGEVTEWPKVPAC